MATKKYRSVTIGKKKYKISDEELEQLEAYAKAQEWLKLTEDLIELDKSVKENPEVLKWVQEMKQKGIYVVSIYGFKIGEDGKLEVVFNAYEGLEPEDEKET